MATFKITVPDSSELGLHIAGKSGRERSMEVYMLASIGMKSISLPQASSVCKLNNEKGATELSPVSADNIPVIYEGVIVDYGSELMNL